MTRVTLRKMACWLAAVTRASRTCCCHVLIFDAVLVDNPGRAEAKQ